MNEGSIKTILVKALGWLWILDGLLQFQPRMFGADFVNNVLVPCLSDQPAFLHAIVAGGIFLWNLNPVISNTAAALLQTGIGILLLFPLSEKRCRAGLWISIAWGTIVWFCGEGAGLVLTGNATFYTGAPGGVLFYVLLAALLLAGERVRTDSFAKIAGWTLLVGSLLQMQPSFWSADGLSASIMTPMMEHVHAVSSLPAFVLGILSADPIASNLLLVLLPLVFGIFVLIRPNRTSASLTLIFLFFVWWFGQDFGGLSTLFTGVSTDPNTAPLLALFLLPIFLKNEAARDALSKEAITRV